MPSEFREDEEPQMSQTNPNLYLQAFLAEVQSKSTFDYLNKDYGYSKLDSWQISMIEHRFKVFKFAQYHLKKLAGKLDEKQLLERFSCLQLLLSMNAATAIVNMSKDGWARQLTQSQFHKVTRIDKSKSKLFGLRKKKEDEYE